MDYSRRVLQTIYEIVKEDADPITYQCRPRELILRLHEDWNLIHEQLRFLQEEDYIQLKQLDTLVILITQNGIERLKQTANAGRL